MMRASSFLAVAAASLLAAAVGSLSHAANAPASKAAPKAGVTLDYEFFKTRVQPVFLTKREGRTRCYVCHSNNNVAFHVVPLSPGATSWNEEQSRRNFLMIEQVAQAGNLESPILKHPLDEKAGGDPHHGGGQQFMSQNDPAWQTLRAFIMGQKG
jgi:cytochrome c1